MTSSSNSASIPTPLARGYSIIRPPLFNGCESAKEVWNKLEVTYEGTNQVKKSKASLLVRDFELFEMKPGETIIEVSPSFEEAELVKRILRSLPKSWEEKTTVIFDTKNFTKYTYDELIGSLIAHKMMFKKEITEKRKRQERYSFKIRKANRQQKEIYCFKDRHK
uniref:Uncharacterized protein n=1 Tax=Manihot esculenta TaxID=3983 RepID=A0A2C9VDX9_MANES